MSTYLSKNEEIDLSWIPSFTIDFSKSNEKLCCYEDENVDDDYCNLNINFVSGKNISFYINKNEKLFNVKRLILKFINKYNKNNKNNDNTLVQLFDIDFVDDDGNKFTNLNISINDICENILCIIQLTKYDYDGPDYISYLTSRLIHCQCTYCTDYDDPRPFAPLCTIDSVGIKCSMCARGIIIPEIELDLENLPEEIPQHIKATDVEWFDFRDRMKAHIKK
jgi:hypothetical protein